MLDELSGEVDAAQETADILTKKTAELVKGLGGPKQFCAIVILSVILIILVLLLRNLFNLLYAHRGGMQLGECANLCQLCALFDSWGLRGWYGCVTYGVALLVHDDTVWCPVNRLLRW